MLRDGNGIYSIICDPHASRLTIKVDKIRAIQQGKSSAGWMLLKLHIYRCTADIVGCREFYEGLSVVDDEALEWRKIAIANKDPPLAFCHANTYLGANTVKIREYEPTADGLIQSWAERDVD